MATSVLVRFAKWGVLGAIAMGVAACASGPTVTSYTDPAYRGQAPKAARMAVLGVEMSLMEQQALEAKAIETFDKFRIPALRGQNVLAPTQTYTTEQAHAALRQAGAELLLEVTALDRQRYESQGPIHISPGFTYARSYSDGNGNTYTAYHHVPGRVSGGHGYTRSDATYRARLINLSNGDVMWQGDANVMGVGSRFDRHAEDMAEKAVEALVNDRMVLATVSQ
ncbi:MAG: hypothetical protein ACPG06_00020 [Alphaproteobacteria bacterium]